MKSPYVVLSLALSLWLGAACIAHAKPQDRATAAKAHQQLMQQVAKSGVRGQDLRELATAIKKDDSLVPAVQGALDKGLRGRELADFCRAEMKNRQPKTADTATGKGMGPGKGMGGGMGQGGMGQGGMGGMGRGMGRGMGGMGGGMGRGMGRGMGGGMGGPGMQN